MKNTMTRLVEVPEIRVRPANPAPINPTGDYVLYWMVANRRLNWNYSLDRAVQWSQKLNKPLLIFEPLRVGYRWASDRIHGFVIQGMANNQATAKRQGLSYYPYLEPSQGAGAGLLKALASNAAVVVSDDFPCFFLPAMAKAASRQVPCLLELVDSNGILPMRAANKVFSRAYDFRRYLQKNLAAHLIEAPVSQSPEHHVVRGYSVPCETLKKWPAAQLPTVEGTASFVANFPIDHRVTLSKTQGGSVPAAARLKAFMDNHLRFYGERRSDVEDDVASGLSPYLHFGHISAHEILDRLIVHESWSPDRLSSQAKGSSEGWWGMTSSTESFLDELITWRELGYNMCWQRTDYDQYESLPDWAQNTLAEHSSDPRNFVYDLGEFEQAQTHDPLWNAAQNQLVHTGKIHNYLRMLWGKKILEWSRKPQDALHCMLELNNKYALDGRNPNSYSGIFWVLGRYDRAWGPERPIFGKIRYMSSENTARKMSVRNYLTRWKERDPA
jgi:deoxyribodipyrimidine photo-lyase